MMKLAIAFLVLAVVAECAPVQPPIEAQEIQEMVIPAIKDAEEPMKQMLDYESAESAEMEDLGVSLGKSMSEEPMSQPALEESVERSAYDVTKASTNEHKQQDLALEALQKVDQLVHNFEARGVDKESNAALGESEDENEAARSMEEIQNPDFMDEMEETEEETLGESNKETPVEHALHSLKRVSSVLSSATNAHVTQERLDRMATELSQVSETIDGGKGGKGAALENQIPPAMENSGAIDALKYESERVPVPELGESQSPGAIDSLMAPGGKGMIDPMMDDVEKAERSELSTVLAQETKVLAAENTDEKEVKKLINTLD